MVPHKSGLLHHGAPNITIYNEAKNMGTFMQSDIDNINNPRLFKMLENTMMYNFEVKYRPGKEMAVADWGSRSPCQEGAHEDFITITMKWEL